MLGAKCKVAAVLAVLALPGLAACGGATPLARHVPPARIQRAGHSGTLSVVLTPLGAQRIGIRTAPAAAAGRRHRLTVVPYQALLYEYDGQTVVYVAAGALAFTRTYVTVRTISGSRVLISAGLTPGTPVVTVGAEELLGVQTGVGGQAWTIAPPASQPRAGRPCGGSSLRACG